MTKRQPSKQKVINASQLFRSTYFFFAPDISGWLDTFKIQYLKKADQASARFLVGAGTALAACAGNA